MGRIYSALVGLTTIAVVTLVLSVIGTIAALTGSLLIAGGLHFLNFVSLGTAQAITIWLIAIAIVWANLVGWASIIAGS